MKHLILHVRDGGYCFAQSVGASFLVRLGNVLWSHLTRAQSSCAWSFSPSRTLQKLLKKNYSKTSNILLLFKYAASTLFSSFFQKRLLKGNMSLKFNVKVSKLTATHVVCFCPTRSRRFQTKCPPKENWKHPSWGFFLLNTHSDH